MDINNDFGLSARTGEAIPLEGVKVKAYINGRGSKVKITQSFKNTYLNPIEAVYKFPLSSDCAVCGFKAIIGDRIIRGEVEDRDEAFKKYDDAMSKGDGAYLLDEDRPNIFTLSVGNLNPGSSAIIEIEYVSLLDSSGNNVKFYLPTTISPRYISKNIPDQNGIPVAETVNPQFRFDVDYGLKINVEIAGKDLISSTDCPSHKLKTSYGESIIYQEFSSEIVKMDRDFVLNISYKEDFGSKAYYFNGGNSGAGFIELDLSPRIDEKDKSRELASKEIIFVLDCSGSMNGSSIVEAKKALEILLRAMKSGDKFNIYRFGSTFYKFSDNSVIYNDQSFENALGFLKITEADLGGTEILAPLKDIFNLDDNKSVKNIILITDGEVGNEDEVTKLVKINAAGNKFFSVGIGYGPNEYFIKELARVTGGASQIIHPEERIEPKILGLFNNLSRGRIENLKIDWQADSAQRPSEIILFEGGDVSIFSKIGIMPDKINVSGLLDNRLLNYQVPVVCLKTDESPIPQLWAREMIKELETDNIMRPGSMQTQIKEKSSINKIIEISKEFGIISSQTSFVAIEERNKEEKTEGEVILKKIPVMITNDWHGIRAGAGLRISKTVPSFPSMNPTSINFYSQINEDSLSSRNDTFFKNAGMMPKSFKSNFAEDSLRAKPAAKDNKKVILSNDKDELLLRILSLQKPSGGFEINEEILKDIGINYKELEKIAKKIIYNSFDNKFNPFYFIYSAAIIEVLKSKFDDEKDNWEAIIRKTDRWLNEQNIKYKPTIDDEEITVFIKKYVKLNLVQ